MPALRVEIARFVDDSQPGWVECEFVDADGRRHTLRYKVPIFSTEWLDAASAYPQPGDAGCEVLAQWKGELGREVVRITTARPCDIESSEGLSEFVVLASQLAASGEAA